jgi:hypothetical protein
MKKKIITLFFAAAMVLSMAFIGEFGSSQNPFSAQGQTVTVKKKKKVGPIRKIGRGGKYVGKKTWKGTKWVGKKTWKGTKYVGKKTWKGTKWVGRKVKKVY